MYRINLYPEYLAKRRQARKSALRTGLLAGVIGLEIVLVCTMILSAALLSDQARLLRAEVGRLSTRLQPVTSPEPKLNLAREMMTVRRARTDWSPKVAALSDLLGPRLQVVEVTGQVADKGRPARFTVVGIWRDAGAEMEPVSDFMDRLRRDQRITLDFPDVQLGTVQGGTSSRFQILCQPTPAAGGSQ